MHSWVPLLFFSLLFLSFFLLHLGFPLVIPLCKLEPICLKCWKLAETLHVFVYQVCVCMCLHACMCGKTAEVAGKGEATECTAALTWWQMKIKRLLLKMGGFRFQMSLFVGTRKIKRVQWRERRDWLSEGVGRHAGTGRAYENKMRGVVFLAGHLKELSFFPTKHG